MANSTEAKAALLSYCRFARQYHYVATEVSIAEGLADVLASDGKNLVEYEIKVSLSDLMKDKDKHKHIIYDPRPITWDGNIGTKGKVRIEIVKGVRTWHPNKCSPMLIDNDTETRVNIAGYGAYDTLEEAKEVTEKYLGAKANTPNTLYYVIPALLWEKHEEKILANLHPSYGVISFEDHKYHSLIVRRKARKLHKNDVTQSMLTTIVARMSSELASLTNMYYNQVKEFTEYGKRVQVKFEMEDEE